MPAPTLPSTSFDAAQDQALLTGYVTNLNQYALLEVGGRDAAVFLHSQLTQDFQSLPEDQARFGGLCSVKGRLIADFLGWHAPSNPSEKDNTSSLTATQTTHRSILLLLSSDLLSEVTQTLSKFIFRRKVTLNEAASKFALIGLVGQNPAWTTLFPTLPSIRNQLIHSDAGTLICLSPALNQPEQTDAPPAPTLPKHYLWILPQSELQARLKALAQHSTPLSSSTWDWLEIQAGEPHITSATQGLLVPQRANFDLLEGINFKKGCYPGQEVVARLQYRGVTRHRTVLMRTAKAQVGQEIFHQEEAPVSASAEASTQSNESNEATSCGVVLNTAPHPSRIDTVDCLVMLPLATLKSGMLHVGAIDGPLLTRLPLPYALPEESLESI